MADILFYGGIAACAISVLGAVVAFFAFRASKARLEKRLDELYGKRGRQ